MAEKSSRPEVALLRLRRRADFLAAQRAIRRAAGALTLEMAPSPENACPPGACRVGFTASRRIGNAIARNRAKRRMRAAARAVLPLCARARHDYVLIARSLVLTRNFQVLMDDLAQAMAAAHRILDARKGGGI